MNVYLSMRYAGDVPELGSYFASAFTFSAAWI